MVELKRKVTLKQKKPVKSQNKPGAKKLPQLILWISLLGILVLIGILWLPKTIEDDPIQNKKVEISPSDRDSCDTSKDTSFVSLDINTKFEDLNRFFTILSNDSLYQDTSLMVYQFQIDKSRISSNNDRLNTIVKILKKFKEKNILIIGHTDNIGNSDYNFKLSVERATAVGQFFKNYGIQAERIKIEGKGEQEPIASNKTINGRKKNRRVALKIVESYE